MGGHEKLLKNPITWLTREIRTRAALRFMFSKEVHVDIGCGPEKYLLRKSPCRTKIGFDRQLGCFLGDKIPIEDKSADYVTMLAVIEHLEFPRKIIEESNRILKSDGILIITTPKAGALWIIKLYSPGFEEKEGGHKQHFDYQKMHKILEPYFSICVYRTFEFGFNQIFVCKKSS
jgi:SAM-dependent methyltransferase